MTVRLSDLKVGPPFVSFAWVLITGLRDELEQRMDLAEDADGVFCEGGADRGARWKLFADDPRLQLFPFFGCDRPAFVLGPFTLFHGIPVALELAREAPLLPCAPRGGLREPLGKRGDFRVAVEVDAESGGDEVRGETEVEFAGRPALSAL